MKKIRTIVRLFFFNSLILSLSIFSLKANSQTKIVAKSGDTLLKISKQYRVPLKELMYKNNLDDATIILEGKVILLPEKNNNKVISSKILTHKVAEGDTLYKIARDYNVKLKDIITINNLSINSILKINQIIILPKGALKKNNDDKVQSDIKKVFYHKTSKLEDLSIISKIHKIPIEEIEILNNSINTVKINPNIKIKLRENKNLKWLKYGSLMINWSDWTYLDGNYVAKAKTKNNKSFFLGLSCKNKALNNTLNNSQWTNWYFPEKDFEFKLINDLFLQLRPK